MSAKLVYMKEQKFEFNYTVYDSIEELPADQQALLKEAWKATHKSYAPYSHFYVGAVAKMANGEIVSGANQENASFPIGLCAERVLLATASSRFPEVPVDAMAISYKGDGQLSDHPISPCGLCRQSLQEFESRTNHPIKLILGGMEGQVYVIESATQLLPLAFTSEELK